MTIPNDPQVTQIQQQFSCKINEHMRKIIHYLYYHGESFRSDMIDTLHISSRSASYALRRLLDAEIVVSKPHLLDMRMKIFDLREDHSPRKIYVWQDIILCLRLPTQKSES